MHANSNWQWICPLDNDEAAKWEEYESLNHEFPLEETHLAAQNIHVNDK